jgi:hypothetical protein
VYAFLRDEDDGRIEEEFDLTAYVWQEWQPDLTRWLAAPRFILHAEVLDWTNRTSASGAHARVGS